ncbi:uncharacterized protein L969DRAFT_614781 [Mixia osmundae IAM 14324]|uniref:Ammonium transporter n=1 Tax=Mixia osmundae (strain CBS 9802 / IAM 14324 / JCM 22182 / KY 12970) TaxID=764103 RepID=G7DXW5_MIXOS|nr:uncharacterized protein L969DRAFT_614781 [Mixia osmundae IAM 14324]KEI41328.1 hypothetical protein L969DRAFT_614781 [Mixia osmundae IAM 14324]GAA95425.1 hypothetical protein E5Q_02079 [Mixia osmundae IAM 14324]
MDSSARSPDAITAVSPPDDPGVKGQQEDSPAPAPTVDERTPLSAPRLGKSGHFPAFRDLPAPSQGLPSSIPDWAAKLDVSSSITSFLDKKSFRVRPTSCARGSNDLSSSCTSGLARLSHSPGKERRDFLGYVQASLDRSLDFANMVVLNFTDSQDMIVNAGTPDEIVYNAGDFAWVLTSTALVMIMTPGLGFFYSGLLRRKNALSMIWASMVVFATVSFQWFFWGYSLTFSPTGSKFIGNLDNFGLMNVLLDESAGSTRIPALLYCIYQLMFAAITPMIAVGAMAERGRLGPIMVFTFVWATLVYDPIACWTWAPNGWAYILPALDFAGGGPVHMSSGTAALAYSIWIGKRRGYGTERLAYKPHNVSHVVLGTVFLWFGWFGFNGGSALSANLRATQAAIVTNNAAAVGGLTWMLLDWRLERKWSAVGFCSGAICGLVGITPASGYVGTPASLAIGVITAACCNWATKLKFIFGYDDALDIFAAHGIGGMVGNLLTGLFADSRVVSFDGASVIDGGWINHHYIQLAYQLADCAAIMGYAFAMTMLILVVMDYIPGLSLRASEEAEIIGVDEAEMGEVAYDYVLLEKDLEAKYFEETGSRSSSDLPEKSGVQPPSARSAQQPEKTDVHDDAVPASTEPATTTA